MQLLRTLSREGRMNELGYKLVALAAHWSLSLRDMAIATERTEAEVRQLITEFPRARRTMQAQCNTGTASALRPAVRVVG